MRHVYVLLASFTFEIAKLLFHMFRHAHQLSPASYNRDCLAILKKVLNHDDTDSDRGPDQKLNTGFKDTCKLWEEIFGCIYPKAGCMWRGDLPIPVESLTVDTNASFKNSPVFSNVQEQNAYLSQRQTVQVRLNVSLLGRMNYCNDVFLIFRTFLIIKPPYSRGISMRFEKAVKGTTPFSNILFKRTF